jgi:hypothetical protein
MKKDKIQEAYEKMITERKIEVRATLESIDEYLFLFQQAMKKGTLEGDMEWGKEKLESIKKDIDKIIKFF